MGISPVPEEQRTAKLVANITPTEMAALKIRCAQLRMTQSDLLRDIVIAIVAEPNPMELVGPMITNREANRVYLYQTTPPAPSSILPPPQPPSMTANVGGE